MSGYFGALTLKWDVSETWDNNQDYSYDANNPPAFANPENLGYIGNAYNLTKAYSSCVGADGIAYFGGEKVRYEEGGGIATYDPVTDTASGYTTGLETANIRNVVAVDKYVAISGYDEDTETNPIFVKVLDTELSSIVRTIEPTSDIYNNAGRLCAGPAGTTDVYILTETDDELSTRIIKVDVSDGSVKWDREWSTSCDVGGYNDTGTADIALGSDGYLYATINGSKWFVRINPANGDIWPVKKFASNTGRFDFLEDTAYFAGSTSIRSVSGFLVSSTSTETGDDLMAPGAGVVQADTESLLIPGLGILAAQATATAALPIWVGENQVSAVYIGDVPITAVYLGSTQIWP